MKKLPMGGTEFPIPPRNGEGDRAALPHGGGGPALTPLRAFGLAATLALAATAVAQPATQTPPPKADTERLICRTVTENGSRLGATRVCRTRAEWAEQRRQTRETIDHIQNSRAGSGQ